MDLLYINGWLMQINRLGKPNKFKYFGFSSFKISQYFKTTYKRKLGHKIRQTFPKYVWEIAHLVINVLLYTHVLWIFFFLFFFFFPTPNGHGYYYGTLMIHDYKVGVAFNAIWAPPPKWIQHRVGRRFPPLIRGVLERVWWCGTPVRLEPEAINLLLYHSPGESAEFKCTICDTDYPIRPFDGVAPIPGLPCSEPYLCRGQEDVASISIPIVFLGGAWICIRKLGTWNTTGITALSPNANRNGVD